MEPESVRFFEDEKFMWDGEIYETRDAAEARRKEYEAENFQTQVVEAENAYLVYSRRVVKEVVVEGEPPPA
ncbi:MAG: hypothetical protein JXR96_04110 [Deltaproteobacteria bacterium]|nr:hypothetical protein [Deltaproteobacteria bacterium]